MGSSSLRDSSDRTPVSFYGMALRLRSGASEIVSWSCDRESMKGTLTVGAAPECDWSIRGPGIRPLELYLEAPDGFVRVKSARPFEGARLDGVCLGDSWVELEPGARLEVGAACLALELNAGSLSGEKRDQEDEPLAFFGTEFQPLPGEVQDREESSVDEPTPQHAWGSQVSKLPKAPRYDATQTHYPPKLNPYEPQAAEARPSVAPSITEPAKTPSGVHAHAPQASSRKKTPAVKRRLWMRYALILVLTLCAYRGWLFLLERF